jgi:DNA-binding XRE family transcriptional regulator
MSPPANKPRSRLAQARAERRVSQAELAEKTGINRRTL